jgi:hypothetical protein
MYANKNSKKKKKTNNKKNAKTKEDGRPENNLQVEKT